MDVLNLSIPMSFLIQAEMRSALVEIGAVIIGQPFQMPLAHNGDEIGSTAANLARKNAALPRTFRSQVNAEGLHSVHQAAREDGPRIEDRILRRGASHYLVQDARQAAEFRSSL
jgi:hypothetical protein